MATQLLCGLKPDSVTVHGNPSVLIIRCPQLAFLIYHDQQALDPFGVGLLPELVPKGILPQIIHVELIDVFHRSDPIGFSGNPWEIPCLEFSLFQAPVQGPLCEGNPQIFLVP